MRFTTIVFIAAFVGLVFVTAAAAPAQGSVGFGYTHFGKNSAFGVGFSAPIYPRYRYHRPYYSRAWRPVYRESYSYPVVYERSYPAAGSVWVPGHWQTRSEQVWVPGETQRVWVEPVHETIRDPGGGESRVIVREGYWKEVTGAGRYETRTVRVWVPGQYASPE
jgi:hypothetical protein